MILGGPATILPRESDSQSPNRIGLEGARLSGSDAPAALRVSIGTHCLCHTGGCVSATLEISVGLDGEGLRFPSGFDAVRCGVEEQNTEVHWKLISSRHPETSPRARLWPSSATEQEEAGGGASARRLCPSLRIVVSRIGASLEGVAYSPDFLPLELILH